MLSQIAIVIFSVIAFGNICFAQSQESHSDVRSVYGCDNALPLNIDLFGFPFNELTMEQIKTIYGASWRTDNDRALAGIPADKDWDGTRDVKIMFPSNTDANEISATYIISSNNPALIGRVISISYAYDAPPSDSSFLHRKHSLVAKLILRYGEPCTSSNGVNGEIVRMQFGNGISIHLMDMSGSKFSLIDVELQNGTLIKEYMDSRDLGLDKEKMAKGIGPPF